jgi:hypothetical protein
MRGATTERLRNGYGTVTERLRNGYGTVTERRSVVTPVTPRHGLRPLRLGPSSLWTTARKRACGGPVVCGLVWRVVPIRSEGTSVRLRDLRTFPTRRVAKVWRAGAARVLPKASFLIIYTNRPDSTLVSLFADVSLLQADARPMRATGGGLNKTTKRGAPGR